MGLVRYRRRHIRRRIRPRVGRIIYRKGRRYRYVRRGRRIVLVRYRRRHVRRPRVGTRYRRRHRRRHLKRKEGQIVVRNGVKYFYIKSRGRGGRRSFKYVLVNYKNVGKIVYRGGRRYRYVKRGGRIVLVRYRRRQQKITTTKKTQIFRNGKWVTVSAAEAKKYK